MKDDVFISKKHGKLTFVSWEPNLCQKRRCKLKCDCGNEIIAYYSAVVFGSIKTCGCSRGNNQSKLWKGFGEISSTHWWSIQHGASNRKHSFKITPEQAWNIFLKQDRKCALTNESLKFNTSHRNRDGNASLDRIDSSKGYTVDNIQWVHKDINRMKSNLSEIRFLDLCKKVVDNHPQFC